MKLAVCIPTFFRPYGLRRVLQSIKDTVAFDGVPDLTVDVVVTRDPEDKEAPAIALAYKAQMVVLPESHQGGAYGWNHALAVALDYDAYVLGSDDIYFMYGVWTETLKQFAAGFGFVGFNDNSIRELRVDRKSGYIIRNQKWVTHFAMTREFIIKYNGGVLAIPKYTMWNLDIETSQRAKRAGQFVHALDANIKHDWKDTADSDLKSARGKKDKIMYDWRESQDFLDDFEAIIK